MNALSFRRLGLTCGATMVELLVASAVLSVISGAVFVGATTLQKSFRASKHYAESQASQLRLIDYVALDLRRALRVEIPASGKIEIWIPDYYKPGNSPRQPRDPQIVRDSNNRLGVQYSGSSIHIAYYIERGADGVTGTLIREENGAKIRIAEDVREFAPGFERSTDAADETEQVFKVSVNFAPKFQMRGDGSSARQGTQISTRVLLRNKRSR